MCSLTKNMLRLILLAYLLLAVISPEMGEAKWARKKTVRPLPIFNINTDAPKCTEGWVYYARENVCIKFFVKYMMTWLQARRYCQTVGGDIAQIKTEEKNTFVKDLAKRTLDYSHYIWIGVRDSDEDGLYENLDGTKIELFGQFSISSNYNRQSCVMLGTKSDTQAWSGLSCESKVRVVCEKKA